MQLAQRARRDYLAAHPQAAPLLIAGSVGPYGAYLADGSEYRGDYRLAQDDMIAFHRPRLAALAAAGVDLLACETLPSFAELQALLTLLQEFPTLGARFAFTLRDSQHLSDGTPLPEVLSALRGNPQVLAIGINCIALDKVAPALRQLGALADKPLLVYPNSGEHYDAVSKTRHACGGEHGSGRSGGGVARARRTIDRRLLPHYPAGYPRHRRTLQEMRKGVIRLAGVSVQRLVQR